MGLGTIGSTGGTLLSVVGTHVWDQDSCLGTSTISTGTTISCALNSPANAMEVRDLQMMSTYIQTIPQDELIASVAEIDQRLEELGVSLPEDGKGPKVKVL